MLSKITVTVHESGTRRLLCGGELGDVEIESRVKGEGVETVGDGVDADDGSALGLGLDGARSSSCFLARSSSFGGGSLTLARARGSGSSVVGFLIAVLLDGRSGASTPSLLGSCLLDGNGLGFGLGWRLVDGEVGNDGRAGGATRSAGRSGSSRGDGGGASAYDDEKMSAELLTRAAEASVIRWFHRAGKRHRARALVSAVSRAASTVNSR